MFARREPTLHPAFITWVNDIIHSLALPLTQKQKLIEACVSMTGLTIGAASAYIMFVLNELFGDSVNARLGIENDDMKNIIRVFFGISAFFPMAALGAINVKDAFLNTVKRYSRPPIQDAGITQKESYLVRFTRGIFVLAAPFSSIPQSTLTWNNISSLGARIGVTCTAVLGPTFFNGRAGQNFIDKCKKKDTKTRLLETHLQACLKKIAALPEAACNDFIAAFFSESDKTNTQGLNALFNIVNTPTENSHTENKSRTAASGTGFLLGAMASIIYYELTVAGDVDPLQIDSSALQMLSGALSYMLNAALSSLATQLCFESIYDWFKQDNTLHANINWPRMRKSFSVLAIFMGIFAAIPLGSLQVEAAQNASVLQTILIFPTFLGPFCVRSRAFENILQRGLNALTEEKLTSIVEEKRALILQVGQEIYKKLPLLADEIKEQLYNLIQHQEAVRTIEIEIQPNAVIPRGF
jgi:hypothetical protein